MKIQVAMSEKLRTEVSNQLTKILVLFSRLDPDTKSRSVPQTLLDIVITLSELEQQERNNAEFLQILSENIEIRDQHSKVFVIPASILADRTMRGIKTAITVHIDPLVNRYCKEQQLYLKNELRIKSDIQYKRSILNLTCDDSKLMGLYCSAHNIPVLEHLITWCEMELSGLG